MSTKHELLNSQLCAITTSITRTAHNCLVTMIMGRKQLVVGTSCSVPAGIYTPVKFAAYLAFEL